MKIFDNNSVSSVQSATSTKSASKGSVKAGAKSVKNGPSKKLAKEEIQKKNISSSEIREKLAANIELSNTGKSKVIANTQKLGDGFLNSDIIPPPKIVQVTEANVSPVEKSDDPNTKDHLIKSDVGLNNPKDSDTTEKLKTILNKGAFNFNPKEREALDRILTDA